MSHELHGEQVIRLEGPIQIGAPDSEGHPHPHVLGALNNLHVGIAQEIGLLQRFQAEIVKSVVARMLDIGVNVVRVGVGNVGELFGDVGEGRTRPVLLVREGLDDLREEGLGILLVIGDGDTGGERPPVHVRRTEGGGHLGGQLVQFACFDSVDNTREDLLGEGVGIDHEPLGRLSDSLQNLIK